MNRSLEHPVTRFSVSQKALRKLEQVIGPEKVSAWLASPQPAFTDLTAGQMLQRYPERVLELIELLEAEGELDEISDEQWTNSGLAQTRGEKDTSRLLAILDEIAGGKGDG